MCPPRARLGISRPSPVAVTAWWALACALAVQAAPVVGGDLVAQQWWTSWASSVEAPVDLGWYGGVPVPSYSLLSPWLGAVLGLPLIGILGTVAGAAATRALLDRMHPDASRSTALAVVVALAWALDQWNGRTTFGLGAAIGCLALVVAGGGGGVRTRRVSGSVLAALAGAVSPVASVFLGVAAAAWWCGAVPGLRRLRGRPVEPWWLTGGALVPLGLAHVLGGVSGPQPTDAYQTLAAVAATCLTGVLVPAHHRVLRAGATWTAVLLVATWLVSGPMGSNSARLVLLFAAPAIVAVARTRPPATAVAALAVVALLPPLLPTDLAARDRDAAANRAAALLAHLADRGPIGRIEVVPLASHQESLLLGRQVPLARGWLRQLDAARGPIFYDGTLEAPGAAAAYLAWLRQVGASYVALPGGRLDWMAEAEAALLRQGVPGLREVWSDGWWELYEVTGGGLVRGDAGLVSSDRSRLVLDVPAPGRVEVALWWSRWASVEGAGGCVRPAADAGWTELTVARPGRFVLTSAWRPQGRCG